MKSPIDFIIFYNKDNILKYYCTNILNLRNTTWTEVITESGLKVIGGIISIEKDMAQQVYYIDHTTNQ